MRWVRAREERQLRERVAARHRRQMEIAVRRSYRLGKFPDTQVRPLDFLAPLMELSQRHEGVAHEVLSSAVSSLLEANDREASELCGLAMDMLRLAGGGEESNKGSGIAAARFALSTLGSVAERIPEAVLLGGFVEVVRGAVRNLAVESGIEIVERVLTLCGLADRGEDEATRAAWLQLVALYSEVGDREVLAGIFRGDLFRVSRTSQLGASQMIHGEMREAFGTFNSALEQLDSSGGSVRDLPPAAEVEFWESMHLSCLIKLSQWDHVMNAALERLERDAVAEPYIGLFLASAVHNAARRDEGLEYFVRLGDEARATLSAEYPDRLAQLHFFQRDFEGCRHRLYEMYAKLSQQWASAPTEGVAARLRLLGKLQMGAALSAVVDVVECAGDEERLRRTLPAVAAWERLLPSEAHDDDVLWEEVVVFRAQSLGLAREWAATSQQWSSQQVEAIANVHGVVRFSNLVSQMHAARDGHRLYAADRAIRELTRLAHVTDAQKFALRVEIVNMHLAKIDDEPAAIDRIFSALQFVVERERREAALLNGADRQREWCARTSAVYERLLSQVQGAADLERIVSAGDILPEMVRSAAESGDRGATVGVLRSMLCDRLQQLALARFCDSQLQLEAWPMSAAVRESYAQTMCRGVLVALCSGGREVAEATHLFPRTLRLLTQFPAAAAPVFRERLAQVPSYLLLRWTAQLLVVLEQCGDCVLEAMKAVAILYPEGMRDVFRMTREQLGLQSAGVRVLDRLLVENAVQAAFMQSLSDMTHPDCRFKDWMDKLYELLHAQPRDPGALRSMWAAMYEDMFVERADLGVTNRDVGRHFSEELRIALRLADDDALRAFAVESCSAKVANDLRLLWDQNKAKFNLAQSEVQMLENYSTWFGRLTAADRLEVPGLYSGRSLHAAAFDSREHALIAAVEPEVLVLKSIRKPKRIAFRGTDERVYRFLVKGGEDLRQDERVVALFDLFNELMESDAECRRRRLRIQTYRVVPLTTKVGLIEWMEDTATLKSVMEEQQPGIKMVELGQHRANWLRSFAERGGGSGGAPDYRSMYMSASRSSAEAAFAKTVEVVKKRCGLLLRRALEHFAPTPQLFLAARAEYARSLAAMSIASYFIGVGDRHLENLLLDCTTGRVLGIDFGHAFGSATQILPIPEMMPFRLTPQLVGALAPLGTGGMLRQDMVRVARALRDRRNVVRAEMQVFLSVPLADWASHALRLPVAVYDSRPGAPPRDEQFGLQKLEIVQRKFSGESPARVLQQELQWSTFAGHPVLKRLLAVAEGDRARSPRALLVDSNGPDAQVDALLDLATDPDVLARAWQGWLPWI